MCDLRRSPPLRPGHPPLVSLRCTRRPLTLERRGRTRLASMGCVCVGGRTAVPRSAPGIPRSFRCAALAAPLRWSEGGVRVWRRWVVSAWEDGRRCPAPPRASPARFAALHSPPPYAGAKGAYASGVDGLCLRGGTDGGAPLRRGHPPLCDWCFGLAPPYAGAKGAYASGVDGLCLRGGTDGGAPLRRGHPPLCNWCFGLAPPYAGAKGACWWVYDVLGCVLGVVGLPCWGFGWILNWVKILG